MLKSKSNNSIDAVLARLTELSAKVVQDGNTGKTEVRLDIGCIKTSQEFKIGFLVGQWVLGVGRQIMTSTEIRLNNS